MRGISLILGAALITAGCSDGRSATQTYPDAVAADPGHYAVEFENDVVRVLRVRYGPGEASEMHSHPQLCSVALTAASWRMTGPDGSASEEPPSAVGDVSCGNEATVHSPENTGGEASQVILFELKDGGAAGTWTSSEPDAVTADPDHYAMEWENDVLRVARIAYGPGESSVLHHHPAYCYVPLDDGLYSMAGPDGEAVEVPITAGAVVCGDADVHLPTNLTDEVGSAVLFEFKGRETAASGM